MSARIRSTEEGRECAGFGPTLGQCRRPVTTPAAGPYWCDECNAGRVRYLGDLLAQLEREFGKRLR